ncbi:serine/threonine-protein kinase Nek8-like [Clytia hemisphaerica]|uniref:serine/threonine-protein kinase Nek8-like n=1 Tax=Clytia hemisphaerica TaxID=252671 RepID=UPI0034D440B0
MNEIHLSSMFDHPNIIKYMEYFLEDNVFNIVMEYAAGGNLYDYLHQRQKEDRFLEEEEVTKFFVQIVRALHHIHRYYILHRDMKTHNILLDRRKKVIKICDFGISKFLTQTSAETTVGTAHYMSPEVVEGKSYNYKSDIWSLGCILHELITLKRTFDAEFLSAIISKILRCDYSPMPMNYSDELRQLVKDILQIDPAKRPDVNAILAAPVLINAYFDLETDVGRIPCYHWNSGNNAQRRKPKKGDKSDRSGTNQSAGSDSGGSGNTPTSGGRTIGAVDDSVYRTQSFTSWGDEATRANHEQTSIVYMWGSVSDTPTLLTLPFHDQLVTSVYTGKTKKLGLTSYGRVVSWENSFATTASTASFNDQGSRANYNVLSPKIIGDLTQSNIQQVCCGDKFVAVRSDQGILMTWGSGEDGCLGHGNTNDVSHARVVEDLVGSTVAQISCGSAHMMALTTEQQVFVWGRGSHGNFGLNDRHNRCNPTNVPLPMDTKPRSVVCGTDCSFIITDKGAVYACGNNRNNKLALLTDNELKKGNFSKVENDCLVFKKITCHPICEHRIISIATGPTHSCFLTESGLLITCGANSSYQLGYERQENDLRPGIVELSRQNPIHLMDCGDLHTVVVTSDDQIYSFGSSRHGRLGRRTDEDYTWKPQLIEIEENDVTIQSLSVSHRTTLLAGKVHNASTLTPMNY